MAHNFHQVLHESSCALRLRGYTREERSNVCKGWLLIYILLIYFTWMRAELSSVFVWRRIYFRFLKSISQPRCKICGNCRMWEKCSLPAEEGWMRVRGKSEILYKSKNGMKTKSSLQRLAQSATQLPHAVDWIFCLIFFTPSALSALSCEANTQHERNDISSLT